MANKKYSEWDLAYQDAWVHYWRRDWYKNILKNFGLWQKAKH